MDKLKIKLTELAGRTVDDNVVKKDRTGDGYYRARKK